MEKTEFELNTKTREELNEGESVLWAGRPAPFPLKNGSNKKGLTLRWIICGALFVILTALYAVWSPGSAAGFKPAVIAVLVIVFGYLMLVPVFDRNKVLKKCQFIVTDKRVLTAVSDSAVFALGRAGLKVSAVPAGNGCVHLLLGAAGKLKEKKYLIRTFAPVKAENGGEEIVGLVFYNVEDTQELRELFGY